MPRHQALAQCNPHTLFGQLQRCAGRIHIMALAHVDAYRWRIGMKPVAPGGVGGKAGTPLRMNERAREGWGEADLPAVLRHRIVLDYNARVEGRTTGDIIRGLLEEVPFQSTATPKVLTAKP